jgi:hypothetical protein
MPAFLHWYPGLTVASYGELDLADWELMKAWIEAVNKSGRVPSPRPRRQG